MPNRSQRFSTLQSCNERSFVECDCGPVPWTLTGLVVWSQTPKEVTKCDKVSQAGTEPTAPASHSRTSACLWVWAVVARILLVHLWVFLDVLPLFANRGQCASACVPVHACTQEMLLCLPKSFWKLILWLKMIIYMHRWMINSKYYSSPHLMMFAMDVIGDCLGVQALFQS